jgi:hypothetical protein
MLTFALFLAVSAMLSPEKTPLDDSLKKFESKYEEEYQQDLKERMDAAETEKQDEQKPAADPDELDAPELKPAPEELDATPHSEDAAPPSLADEHEAAAHAMTLGPMDAMSSALAGLKAADDQPSVDEALEKLKSSAKMMVVLHVLMKPISAKLHLAMAKMGDADKEKAQGVLDHLGQLDGLSAKAVELLKHVEVVKHGSPEERAAALESLVSGMKEIQGGVQTHLLAMKRPGAGERSIATTGKMGKLTAMTQKLHAQMHKMDEKVKAELADPERKDDPLVKLDVEVLGTMKHAVKKAESLVVVAAVAMKQAKDEDEKTKIKHAIKAELQGVMTDLKENMRKLKEKTVIVEAVRKLKDVGGLKGLIHHLKLEGHLDQDEHDQDEHEEHEQADAPKADDDAPKADDGAAKDEADETKPDQTSPARPPKSDGKFDHLLDQLDQLKSSFKGKDSPQLRKNTAEDDSED